MIQYNEDNGKIKENLLKLFPDRDSASCVSPLMNGVNAKNLNSYPIGNLSQEFQRDFEVLRKKIYRDVNCKKIRGKKLNGFTIANVIEEFIERVNNGETPEINSM